jgi:hypothetical protein
MQCARFEDRLNELLDERLRPECDAELLAHAQRCDTCRELLAISEQLFLGLELRDYPEVSPDFAQRVVAVAARCEPAKGHDVLVSSPSRDQKRWSLPAWVGVAVAASLLLATIPLLGWLNRSDPSSVANREGEVVTPQPNVPQKRPEPKPNTVPMVAQETEVPGEGALPQESSPRMIDERFDVYFPEAFASHIVLSPDDLLDGRQTGQMIRSLTSRLPDVPVDETPGLRPFATSFSLTLGMVRKTLPGGRDSSNEPRKTPAPATKPQAEKSPATTVQLS